MSQVRRFMKPRATRESIQEDLRRHPLLTGVAEETLRHVVDASALQVYAPGEILNREGDPSEHYWLLCRGSAKVFYTSPEGFEVVVKIFHAPAAWAEMEILTGQPHIEDCVAVDRATVLKLPRASFEELLLESPRFMKNVLVDTCARFLIAAQNERALAFLSVPERLAHLLLAYVRLYGVPVEGGVAIRIKLSQNDLANGLGAARRSVVRALTDMQRDGVIAKRGTSYVVRDVEKLAALTAHGLIGVDWIAGTSVARGQGSRPRR
jgi:CRP-like cAMP-binding protein